MYRKSLAALAAVVMSGSSLAADYNFPSHAVPGNKPLSEVKQIVSFVWDDNAYSGLEMTNYETAPGQSFADQSWIGGKKPWGATAPNALSIQPGQIGMSWAITELAGRSMPMAEYKADATYTTGMQVVYNGKIWECKYWTKGTAPAEGDSPFKLVGPYTENFTKKNSDGTPILFTFNVISGLVVPLIGPEDGARETKYGYWTVNAKDVEEFPHLSAYFGNGKKIAACWGREMMVKASKDATGNVNGETYGQINEVFKMTTKMGHEIGNHTLDHMESNSPLPNDDRGYGRWGGEGFAANMIETVKWGSDALGYTEKTVDESVEFGRTAGISWHSMGWKPYAGRILSTKAWKGILELGEVDMDIELGLKPLRKGGTIAGFRAPRLEVNSNQFFALAELGYMYDTGLEDGLDATKDGTNFVWPYTMENGSPNTFTMRKNGYTTVAIDSMPVGTGLWQFPVNNVIVHPDDRASVFEAYKGIQAAQKIDVSGDKEDWIKSGKITGFDFNMFILWGMTGDQATRALKYTLDKRMAGNKAPMQVGLHTDYFTPMYDIATLQAPENLNSFGQALKYNKYPDRKKTLIDFRDYAIDKGALFKTAKETIDYVKSLQKDATIGSTVVAVAPSEWTLMKDAEGTSGTASVSNLDNAILSLAASEGAWGGYYGDLTGKGASFKGLSHVELDYKTNTPLYLTLQYEGGKRRDVLLNNLSYDVPSGKIPVTAFADLTTGESNMLDAEKIIGIAVYPQKIGDKASTAKFSVKNVKFYTGAQVSIRNLVTTTAKPSISMNGISNGQLNLAVTASGTYSVNLYSTTGRIVKSLNSVALTSGANALQLGTVPAGMYIVKIQGAAGNLVSKAVVR